MYDVLAVALGCGVYVKLGHGKYLLKFGWGELQKPTGPAVTSVADQTLRKANVAKMTEITADSADFRMQTNSAQNPYQP